MPPAVYSFPPRPSTREQQSSLMRSPPPPQPSSGIEIPTNRRRGERVYPLRVPIAEGERETRTPPY
eukprot:283940-Prorocentrum_minimum.AAC.1